MTLLICGSCGAVYASARRCPHCGARDDVARFDWEERGMPKATVDGGASNYAGGVPAGEEALVAAVTAVPTAPVRAKSRPAPARSKPAPPSPAADENEDGAQQ